MTRRISTALGNSLRTVNITHVIDSQRRFELAFVCSTTILGKIIQRTVQFGKTLQVNLFHS